MNKLINDLANVVSDALRRRTPTVRRQQEP